MAPYAHAAALLLCRLSQGDVGGSQGSDNFGVSLLQTRAWPVAKSRLREHTSGQVNEGASMTEVVNTALAEFQVNAARAKESLSREAQAKEGSEKIIDQLHATIAELSDPSSESSKSTHHSMQELTASFASDADKAARDMKAEVLAAASVVEAVGAASDAAKQVADLKGSVGAGIEEYLDTVQDSAQNLQRHLVGEAFENRARHGRNSSRGDIEKLSLVAMISEEDRSEDVDRRCEPMRLLDFSAAEVTQNNLGGQGPDSGPEGITFTGIIAKDGVSVDLTVNAVSAYTPFNVAKNGLGGPFGTINLRADVGNSVALKFRTVDHSSGEPVILDPFYFTIFDLDQGRAHGARERVTVSGFESYTLAEGTEIRYERLDRDAEGHKTATFTSSKQGGKVDNPVMPVSMTRLQRERSVSFSFADVSEFSVILEEVGWANPQGRNYFFSGGSQLVCAGVHKCSDYACPAGYALRNMAEFLVCAGRRCQEEDRDTCCFEEPAVGEDDDDSGDEEEQDGDIDDDGNDRESNFGGEGMDADNAMNIFDVEEAIDAEYERGKADDVEADEIEFNEQELLSGDQNPSIEMAHKHTKRQTSKNELHTLDQKGTTGITSKSKLHIGDQVQYVGSAVQRGHIGTVVRDDFPSAPFIVKFPDGYTGWFKGSDLRAVDETGTAIEKKLRVGDQAEYWGPDVQAGQTGTIVRDNFPSAPFVVKFNDYTGWFKASELRAVATSVTATEEEVHVDNRNAESYLEGRLERDDSTEMNTPLEDQNQDPDLSSPDQAAPASGEKMHVGNNVQYIGSQAQHGEIGTVVRDDFPSAPFVVKFPSDYTGWYKESELRVVADRNLDAGDQNEESNHKAVAEGNVSIEKKTPIETQDKEADLSVADQGKLLSEKVLQVGDDVKYIGSQAQHGQIGTIVRDDFPSAPFVVKFPNGYTGWYNKSELVEAQRDKATMDTENSANETQANADAQLFAQRRNQQSQAKILAAETSKHEPQSNQGAQHFYSHQARERAAHAGKETVVTQVFYGPTDSADAAVRSGEGEPLQDDALSAEAKAHTVAGAKAGRGRKNSASSNELHSLPSHTVERKAELHGDEELPTAEEVAADVASVIGADRNPPMFYTSTEAKPRVAVPHQEQLRNQHEFAEGFKGEPKTEKKSPRRSTGAGDHANLGVTGSRAKRDVELLVQDHRVQSDSSLRASFATFWQKLFSVHSSQV